MHSHGGSTFCTWRLISLTSQYHSLGGSRSLLCLVPQLVSNCVKILDTKKVFKSSRNTRLVYFYNVFQAFSFKMNSQKSNSHKESLHSANFTMSKAFRLKKETGNSPVEVKAVREFPGIPENRVSEKFPAGIPGNFTRLTCLF